MAFLGLELIPNGLNLEARREEDLQHLQVKNDRLFEFGLDLL
jgi:hypothetical protein